MSYNGVEYKYQAANSATGNLSEFQKLVSEAAGKAFEDDMVAMTESGKFTLVSGGTAYGTKESAIAAGPGVLASVYKEGLSAAWDDLLSNAKNTGTTAGGFGSQVSLSLPTVSDYDKANATLKAVQNAINAVSTQRSALGALQNRLEHTVANLDNVSENTQAAESRIRDTDMASQMVEYSKNNILAQAGQSMLAQSNQSTQGVLSLLQ